MEKLLVACPWKLDHRSGDGGQRGTRTPVTSNPEGLPTEVFDRFRSALADNRAQFFREVPAGPFYGFSLEGTKTVNADVLNTDLLAFVTA